MIRTRKERTKIFREQVECEWHDHFKKFIEDNQDKSWWWDRLSANPNITLDSVLSHSDKPWE